MLRSAFALAAAVAIVATETAAVLIVRACKPVIDYFLPAKKTGAVEAVEIVDGEEVYWGVEYTPTDDDLFPFEDEDDDDEIVATAHGAAPPRAPVPNVAATLAPAAAPRAARRVGPSPYQAAAMEYLLAAQQQFRDGNVNAALLAEPTAEFGSPSNVQRMTVQEGRLLYATAGLPAPANLTQETIFFVESIFVRPNPALEWFLDVEDPIDEATQQLPAQCGCGRCANTASSVRMCAFLLRLQARQDCIAHCARRSAIRGARSPFGRRLP